MTLEKMLLFSIGFLIGETIYQRLRWWVKKKYYYRKYFDKNNKSITTAQFNDISIMMVFCSELLKSGATLLHYQEVDFSRLAHKVIFKLKTEEIK